VKSPDLDSNKKSDLGSVGTDLGAVKSAKSDVIGMPNSELKWLASVGICTDDLASLVVKHRNGSTTYLYDLGEQFFSRCSLLSE